MYESYTGNIPNVNNNIIAIIQTAIDGGNTCMSGLAYHSM